MDHRAAGPPLPIVGSASGRAEGRTARSGAPTRRTSRDRPCAGGSRVARPSCARRARRAGRHGPVHPSTGGAIRPGPRSAAPGSIRASRAPRSRRAPRTARPSAGSPPGSGWRSSGRSAASSARRGAAVHVAEVRVAEVAAHRDDRLDDLADPPDGQATRLHSSGHASDHEPVAVGPLRPSGPDGPRAAGRGSARRQRSARPGARRGPCRGSRAAPARTCARASSHVHDVDADLQADQVGRVAGRGSCARRTGRDGTDRRTRGSPGPTRDAVAATTGQVPSRAVSASMQWLIELP